MRKENMQTLKNHLFTNMKRFLAVFALSGISLLFVACGKDDPEPRPVPPDPVPPTPPTPVVPDAPRAVALRLLALPAGENPEPWSVADTLHLVLTEPNGRTALGDTALYRYAFGEGEDHPGRFLPVSVADSAFLPADSSEVDLMAYRPASLALQSDRLRLPVDSRELTSLGRPLMTAARTVGIHAGQPEASIVLSHRLTRLYVSLNKVGKASPQKSSTSATKADGTAIVLHGNPAQGIWSLPDEAFVEYGEPVSQPFIIQSDEMGGYLYALPGWLGQSDGQKPELSLSIQIPERDPLEVPLNKYLPEGLLEAGISIDIQIEVPEVPVPDPDPTPDPEPDPDPTPKPDPDPAPDPAPSPEPDPSPDPDPAPDPAPDSDILRIKVTLSDWENIIYDITILPDGSN